jgi:hypothetical protein
VSGVHSIWAQALDWLPPPLRVTLFLCLLGMLLVRGVPALLHWSGRALNVGAKPVMLLLTFPEYVTTSMSRRFGWRLLPGTYAYGRLLGTVADGLGAVGRSLSAVGSSRRRRLPVKVLLLVVLALTLTPWYAKADALPKPVRPTAAALRGQVAQADVWLGSGHWVTPRTTVANWCTVPASKPARPAKPPRKTK